MLRIVLGVWLGSFLLMVLFYLDSEIRWRRARTRSKS